MQNPRNGGRKKIGRVLFVDDEINVLRSIKRGFLQSDIEVLTAPGAREGLQLLRNERIDIVVTDYRMPHMNGLQFLQRVREMYPKTARVILSGYIEKTVAVESLTRGLASTYILKPWLNEDIERKIRHLLSIRDVLQSQRLLGIINGITNLPSLSNIFHEFMTAVHEEKSMTEISRILQKDPTVATKVLQIANSAFYGMKNCNSINQAAVTLGLDTLQDILLTISVVNSMKWEKHQIGPLQDIFVRSFIMNHYLPVIYGCKPQVITFRSFPSVGLTYDVGRIILLQYYPDSYRSIIDTMKKNPEMGFHDAELYLGFEQRSHQEIGAYFLDYWNLPEIFIETALFHHDPQRSTGHYRDMVEIINYIDSLISFVYKVDGNDDDAVASYRTDFIPESVFRDMIAYIREKLDGGIGIYIPH
jgi:HD-like signal output (HDOD) protein/ActR/RegA family two-component response regulator